MNAKLISELLDHKSIDSAWYFNGSVFGRTTDGKRMKFDLYDDIDAVVAKAIAAAAAAAAAATAGTAGTHPPIPEGSMD